MFKNKLKMILTVVFCGMLMLTPVAQAATDDGNVYSTQVIAQAESYLGTPYLWGGTTAQGIDCSALVQNSFKMIGVNLPRVSRDQFKMGTFVPARDLQPGDLVFFSFLSSGQVSHVGIYLGNSQFVHASSSKGVTNSLFSPYWWGKYVGAKRIITKV